MEDKEYYNRLIKAVAGRLIAFLLGVAVAALLTVLMSRCGRTGSSDNGSVIERNDTVTIRDTIPHSQPAIVHDTVIRWKTVYVQRGGTASAHEPAPHLADDTTLMLPISHREYTDDSTYRAWVSGYDARLDSIETYRTTVILNNATTISSKSTKRWSVGLQGGLYATPKGVQPGIGIGVTWRLWPP